MLYKPASPAFASLRVPLRFAKGAGVDAFNSPFGGIFVRRVVVEGSPRLGVACDKLLVCSSIVQHRRRRQTVGPPGSVDLKDQPPSSLGSHPALAL